MKKRWWWKGIYSNWICCLDCRCSCVCLYSIRCVLFFIRFLWFVLFCEFNWIFTYSLLTTYVYIHVHNEFSVFRATLLNPQYIKCPFFIYQKPLQNKMRMYSYFSQAQTHSQIHMRILEQLKIAKDAHIPVNIVINAWINEILEIRKWVSVSTVAMATVSPIAST